MPRYFMEKQFFKKVKIGLGTQAKELLGLAGGRGGGEKRSSSEAKGKE